ncbi:BREX-1 system adenine-specific DNA-methyltransferase PglX [Companilactobacillus sp. FL22-1]|uniref:BREX-1 system adenine-specific DNA-methyltransferase PglX n=1 Tax=Companilactobacillus sp. FL22-1 TaxID=3373892 RepID=UPI0037544531
MDKNAIKKFAINSRENLLEMVRQRAGLFGITKDGISDKLEISTNEIEYYVDDKVPLVGKDIPKRRKLVEELKTRAKKSDYQTAFTDLTEEVAYTWFNRIVAIRFMEVNDYLPSRTRVLSSTQNRNEPDIMIDPLSLEADLGAFSDDDRQLIDDAWETEDPLKMDDLYKMLFIKQVNALNKNLPYLFEKTNDYAELLFTPNYNRGVIKSIVTDIDEADFDVSQGGQVEIIGWIYQYYNTELHDEVVNISGGAVKKSDIPAATQLFTTDWVVRYMVDNSLGKYWLERHPDSKIKNDLKFLLPEKLDIVPNSNEDIQDIKLMDNAMGSGHILIYAFDIFMKIYLEEGYSARDAAVNIITKNLYGLEIDQRAFQLASFSLMMKAREYNRRILRKSDIKPNLHVFVESDDINPEFFDRVSTEIKDDLQYLVSQFKDAKELGSIIRIDKKYDFDQLRTAVENIPETGIDLYGIQEAKNTVLRILDLAEDMSIKYNVVATNPPYLNKMDKNLKAYVKKNYADYAGDLFSVFIYNNTTWLAQNGYSAYMTPFVWMFIKTYEKLRTYLVQNKKISSLIQMEYSAFEEATVPINTFVIKNTPSDNTDGVYVKLSDFKGGMEVQKEKTLEAIENPECGYLYRTNQANFSKIPGSPIAYWTSSNVFSIFQKSKKISDYGYSKKGLDTGKNALYYRFWHEVSNNVGYWIPLNKGGNFRKWYGNQIYIINWLNDGYRIKNNGKANIQNEKFYFKPNLSWTDLTSGSFSARYTPRGFIFDASGPSYFGNNLNEMLAYLNSTVFNYLAKLTMSTMHYTNGQVAKMPFKDFDNGDINSIVTVNISISKKDWDSFETSWDFQQHPFLNHIADDKRTEVDGKVENAFNIWKSEAQDRFNQLKSNEEELNKIFIDLYGLQDELTPEVADKDVSVRLADKERDIKSFLSYFIGVVFGRYSLDTDGLAFAGGEWDASKYKMFVPNDDNLLMLNDAKYFDDERDIINRLKEFLTVTFGKETLSDNLQYIASVVGKKADSDEDSIRRYFVEDFFKDHKKIYQKRPIYW